MVNDLLLLEIRSMKTTDRKEDRNKDKKPEIEYEIRLETNDKLRQDHRRGEQY